MAIFWIKLMNGKYFFRELGFRKLDEIVTSVYDIWLKIR